MTPEKIAEFLIEKSLTIAYCIAVIIAAVILVKVSRVLITRFLSGQTATGKMLDDRKAKTMASVASSVVKYIIYFFCGCAILEAFGVPIASLIAVASVGSVAIGFGAQSIVKDIFAGFFIVLEDQFGIGDIVTIEGYSGTVECINMRTTQIRGYDGTVYIIPNGNINIITNMCKEYICAVVNVDVDYSTDISKALQILKDEMEKCSNEIQGIRGMPNVLGPTKLGESGITIRIVAECDVKENFRIERELNLRVKKCLEDSGISIPFPQRTLHIVKEV